MSWHLYVLEFQLKSPVHIGFHKVMHLFRTRPYVPAKPMWGAITAKLTRELKIHDYERVGNFLNSAMRFGYFYLSDGDDVYLPKYTDSGLVFGRKRKTKTDFEKRFIISLPSAAIDPKTLTAEEGMLHEVEFISPHLIGAENSKPAFLRGLIWVRETSQGGINISGVDDNDLNIKYNGCEIKFGNLVDNIQVGGERKYGFGMLKLRRLRRFDDDTLNQIGFYGTWREENDNVILKIDADNPIWAHLCHGKSLKIKGEIEPLVGRSWDMDRGAGKNVESHGICWAPGSIVTEDASLSVGMFGIWELVQ